MEKARFVKSAVLPEDYPAADRPEIALVGRSNAGKSTLLNAMTGGQKLAHVSNTPGKTRLLNFFDVGRFYRLVDLPGYGYAARNQEERAMWSRMIFDFFQVRESLVGLILVCDIRRVWEHDERMIYEMAHEKGLGFLCVLTKIDKLGRAETQRHYNAWLKSSRLPAENFNMVSAVKNDGVQEVEDYIFKTWIKPRSAPVKPT